MRHGSRGTSEPMSMCREEIRRRQQRPLASRYINLIGARFGAVLVQWEGGWVSRKSERKIFCLFLAAIPSRGWALPPKCADVFEGLRECAVNCQECVRASDEARLFCQGQRSQAQQRLTAFAQKRILNSEGTNQYLVTTARLSEDRPQVKCWVIPPRR